MARNFLTAVNLNKNELQNPQVHNLAAAPSSPVKGQLYMNTSDNTLYWWDGTTWQSAKGGVSSVFYQTIRDGGVAMTQRAALNFIDATSANLTVSDDAGNNETDVFVSLNWSGSVTASTSFGQASNAGSSGVAARADHVHGTPTHDNAAHSAIELSSLAPPSLPINMNNQRITSLGTPTQSGDATTKAYVDNLTAGLSWKEAVRAATTTNITLSGAQTIDGVAVVFPERVLVKNQSTATQNGIYTVAAGAWARATDADAVGELEGAAVFVMEGTTQADTAWVCTTDGAITPGTTANAWAQFSGGAGVPTTRQIISGNGLTGGGDLSADRTLAVVAANGSIVVGADDVQVGYAGSGGNNGTAVTAARSDHSHALMARTTSIAIPAGTSYAFAHGFNSRNVIVNVYRNSTPWDTVECDVERTDANTVTVRFAASVASSEYQMVVAV